MFRGCIVEILLIYIYILKKTCVFQQEYCSCTSPMITVGMEEIALRFRRQRTEGAAQRKRTLRMTGIKCNKKKRVTPEQGWQAA